MRIHDLNIEFEELDAWRQIPTMTYDDHGNAVGPNPDYEAHYAQARGQSVFVLKLTTKLEHQEGELSTLEPCQMRIQSPFFRSDIEQARKMALYEALRAGIKSFIKQVTL
jgi:hypothetical protein